MDGKRIRIAIALLILKFNELSEKILYQKAGHLKFEFLFCSAVASPVILVALYKLCRPGDVYAKMLPIQRGKLRPLQGN